MKARIISGTIMLTIVVVVLIAGYSLSPWVITSFVAGVGMVAIYELIHNAGGVKNTATIIGACSYVAIATFLSQYSFESVFIPTILYGIYSAILIIINHKHYDFGKISLIYGLPVPIAISFCTLNAIINNANGFYYLLLLFNFSSICDIGAYFTGITIGKHKLCPEISPKKTVEGAIGGIVLSIVCAIIITFCFNRMNIILFVFTIPLCILGIVGDLLASVVKRSVGIKDFSNLIPSHGGVMDRIDSMLMVAPAMFLLVKFGII